MMHELIEYYKQLYFPILATRVVPILACSAICAHWQPYESTMEWRFRLNVLCYWKAGLFKTSVLSKFAKMAGLKTSVLTATSDAALRGSFTDREFYPPEFRINDLIVMGELGSCLSTDESTITSLLTLLEEGNARIALIKGKKINVPNSVLQRYGCWMEDGRLCYKAKATVWAGTHTIDGLIPDQHRDAFMSRWITVSIADAEIPRNIGWADYQSNIDRAFEERVTQWFGSLVHELDEDFMGKLAQVGPAMFAKETLTPRQINDIKRLAMGWHSLYPELTAGECLRTAGRWMIPSLRAKISTVDRIENMITHNPKSMMEIIETLGISESTFYRSIKALGTQVVHTLNYSPKLYYIAGINHLPEHREDDPWSPPSEVADQ